MSDTPEQAGLVERLGERYYTADPGRTVPYNRDGAAAAAEIERLAGALAETREFLAAAGERLQQAFRDGAAYLSRAIAALPTGEGEKPVRESVAG